MHLKDLLTGPPGGWRYTQPESGHTIVAITFGSLVKKVSQHRQNMKYASVGEEFSTLKDEVEDAICRAMPPVDQVAHCITTHTPDAGVHWRRVARFFGTMVEWIKVGFERVPQEEAERRASICNGCPFNLGMTGCGVCRTTLLGVRQTVLRGAGTTKDSKLEACGICGCDNKAQVHIPLSVLKAGSKLEYPAWCWKASPTTSP